MSTVQSKEIAKEYNSKSWQDLTYSTFDGLNLYARHYRAHQPSFQPPLICLPGLTRNAKDFHALAMFLSEHAPKPLDVYCLDFRGRGDSDYDPERKYDADIELLDVINFLTVFSLHKVSVLGSSRGGVVTLKLASARPGSLHKVILNDTGPVFETGGMTRVLSMIAKAPFPNDWSEAVQLVRQMHGSQFKNLQANQWMSFARRYYNEEDDLPAPHYDPQISQALVDTDLTRRARPMWREFQALRHIPVLVLRGELSDMLSAETVVRMGSLHAQLKTHMVQGEGHTPLLEDRDTQKVIANFIAARSN